MRRLALILIAVVIVIGAIVLFAGGKKSSNQTQNSPSPTANQGSDQSNAGTAQSAITVTYNSNGFSPSSSTVASGGKVTFTNNSASTIQVDSDPHPAHTDNTELNVGLISPGQSQSVTLTTKGHWGIHNHLDPGFTATIIVQ